MREEDEIYSTYDHWSVPILKTKEQVLKELSEPCSRFTFSAKHIKSDLGIARLAAHFDPFAKNSLLLATGVPANWQLFAQYLYEKKVTRSSSIFFYEVRNDIPKLYQAFFLSSEKEDADDGKEVNRYGYGSSFNQEEAVSKATGELLERYFLGKYRNQDLIRASYDELAAQGGARPLNLSHLNGFLPWQKKENQRLGHDMDNAIRWVRGTNISTDTPAYLPARLVFWNYVEPHEMFIGESNTNGSAGHFTRDEAILSGLLEYIQRDGFIIHWLKVKSPRRIDEHSITDAVTVDLLARLRAYKLDTYLLDVTTDVGVPTCACIIVDRRNGAYVMNVGASAGFNEQEVFLSAIKEAFSGQNRLFTDKIIDLTDSYQPFSDSQLGQDERLRIWRGKAMYDKLAPFLEGLVITSTEFLKGMTGYETSSQHLSFIKERLRALGEGYEVYVHEAQDPILTKIGYHVVKVIVPRLINLYLWENNVTLAAERLEYVPKVLGYIPRDDLNPLPHFFP
jgi:thiazole/oxazole-forming peptide maturase SagD family component